MNHIDRSHASAWERRLELSAAPEKVLDFFQEYLPAAQLLDIGPDALELHRHILRKAF